MLENNHFAVTVNHDSNGEIAVFKFMTYEGKELVVNGALATNVCDFMNYDQQSQLFLANKQAWRKRH